MAKKSLAGWRLWWRDAAWLAILLIALALDIHPQRDYYATTGDIQLYQFYGQALFEHPPRLPQEYPPLTALIFAVPQTIVPTHYMVGFGVLAALVAALLVSLVDRQTGRGGWLLVYMLISGFATLFFRYDGFVVLVTLAAFLCATNRRWLGAQIFLALGVALKLYPALLMPLVVLWAWRTEGAAGRVVAIRTAIVGGTLLLLVFGLSWWLAPDQLDTMLHYHRTRPLQIESLGATIAWLTGPAGSIFSFGSVNVTSTAGPTIITLLTLGTLGGVGIVYLLFAARRLAPAPAWALVLLVSIITSKVFSTQYILWALPFVVLAGEKRLVWLMVCVATVIVYPIAFFHFQDTINQTTLPWWFALPVAVRNGLWLFACAVELPGWLQAARQETSTRQRSTISGAA